MGERYKSESIGPDRLVVHAIKSASGWCTINTETERRRPLCMLYGALRIGSYRSLGGNCEQSFETVYSASPRRLSALRARAFDLSRRSDSWPALPTLILRN